MKMQAEMTVIPATITFLDKGNEFKSFQSNLNQA